MDINKLLRADYLDIIFDGRNKAYGGYELRRKYSRRSRRAGIIVIAAAALLSGVPTLASMMGKKADVPVISERIHDLIPPPVLPKPEVTPPPPPPPVETQYTPPPITEFNQLVVKPDEQVERPPATQDDLENTAIGPTTTTGQGDPRLEIGPEGPSGPPGGALVDQPKPKTIMTIVDQQAQFPGDLASWLGNHLRYPESAREDGVEGRSILQFVVNEDGSITDVRVARSASTALDAEALRVVRSMPKWKPGKQNGVAVASYFSLPIEFRLN